MYDDSPFWQSRAYIHCISKRVMDTFNRLVFLVTHCMGSDIELSNMPWMIVHVHVQFIRMSFIYSTFALMAYFHDVLKVVS